MTEIEVLKSEIEALRAKIDDLKMVAADNAAREQFQWTVFHNRVAGMAKCPACGEKLYDGSLYDGARPFDKIDSAYPRPRPCPTGLKK